VGNGVFPVFTEFSNGQTGWAGVPLERKGQMDYLIIGAGPAGLQLGYFMRRKKRDFLILEAGSVPGSFFKKFPRHRTLISINKVYTGSTDPESNLRMDWNSLLCDNPDLQFGKYSRRYFPAADDLVRYLGDFAVAHDLPIVYRARVVRIARAPNGLFRVRTEEGQEYEAKRVILATGVSQPYVPPIPGIETADQYADVSIDPTEFTDKKVLIIGKGNSAFETADNLMETTASIHIAGPKSLQLAWRTHYVGHLRAINNNFLDTYQLKSLNALIDGNVENIVKDARGYTVTVSFVRANEVKKHLRYDRVIVCTGFRFDTSIFDESDQPRLAINGRFPELTTEWESTNLKGLFFAGTLMQTNTFKKSTTGFIHGFRYSVRALHHILERRFEKRQWPCASVPVDPRAMMAVILERANRSSALWQQFACLCDLLVVTEHEARYYQELPTDYVHKSDFGQYENYFTVSLEYGPDHDKKDPFDVGEKRISQDDHLKSDEGHYLHPVVRHYSRGTLLSTHHVTENLENDWTLETVHRQPLERYLTRALNPIPENKKGGRHVHIEYSENRAGLLPG